MGKVRKENLLVLFILAIVYLTGCVVTPVALRDYKQASPEEAAILSVIIAFEESFNKVDQKLFLNSR